MSGKNNKHPKKRYLLLKVFSVLLLFAIISISAFLFLTYNYYAKGLPDLKDITSYKPTLVNEIYASDGTMIGRFGLEKRKLIDLNKIPKHVIDSFIAVEDKRFFEHSGLDFKGILRAFIENMRKGEVVAGGSTITQQVTKNLILSPERTLSRKIKEAILAHRIEKNLSKEEILYLYLNHIYLADGTYGIEAASMNYYGKSSKNINISEAALLAGIPKRPERYSPRKHLDNAIERQKVILKIMYEENFINEDQYNAATEYTINILPKSDINYQVSPYFVEHVRKYLENMVGEEQYKLGGYKVFTTIDIDLSLSAQWALRKGIYDYETRWNNNFVKRKLSTKEGINKYIANTDTNKIKIGNKINVAVTSVKGLDGPVKIATIKFGKYKGQFKYVVFNKNVKTTPQSIDFRLSKKFLPVDSYKGIYVIPDNLAPGNIISVKILNLFENNNASIRPQFQNNAQAGIVSIDSNGNVVAMVGGFDFHESQFNRAYQAYRQPGSSFKPLVYSAAIDKGYTQTTVLFDMPITIDDWEPRNYDGTYKGAIVLRDALSNSRNLATIRMLLDIGPEYVANYSNRFKFKSTLNPYPSLALGGSDVTIFEMVQAFSVFSNGGIWVEPRFVYRIYDRNNQIIEDNTGQYFEDKEKKMKRQRNLKRKELLEELSKKKGRALTDLKTKDEELNEKEFAILKNEDYEENEFLAAEEFVELLKKGNIEFGPANTPERLINNDTSYIITDLLRAVINEGTGRRASHLNSIAPVAGKTGTTNDYTDAWFVGYSPDITTGVWVGKDNHSSLGKKESGSRAALPIWIDFMKEAISRNKGSRFKVPDSVKLVDTPYGTIPYRVASLRDNIIKSLRDELDDPKIDVINTDTKTRDLSKYKMDEFSDEEEIDFLLRR